MYYRMLSGARNTFVYRHMHQNGTLDVKDNLQVLHLTPVSDVSSKLVKSKPIVLLLNRVLIFKLTVYIVKDCYITLWFVVLTIDKRY